MLKILFIFLFLINGLFANVESDFILLADKFYDGKDYQKAYELYKKRGFSNASLNYKLGMSAYNLGEFGYAMLYLKRAEYEWGFFNRFQLLDKINEIKREINGVNDPNLNIFISLKSFKDYVFSLLRSTNLFAIKFIFFLFWIFSFFYIRYLFKRKRIFQIYFLFILMFISGVIFIGRHRIDYKHYGVVIRSAATVLSGPDFGYSTKLFLPEATVVRILQRTSEFYKIKLRQTIGWVNKDFIEPILIKK